MTAGSLKLPPDRPIRSVLIAGSGIEAWLTAALLAHRLDGRQIDIRVCPVSGSNDWDGLYTTLPAFPGDLFRELGYSDLKLARFGDASFSLGTRLETASSGAVLKPHGPVGVNVSGVGFHQYWRSVSQNLTPGDYFAYSPGAMAMEEERFAPPVQENAIGPLQHEMARHIDPWAMQKQLRHQAYAMGVTELRSVLQTAHRDSDNLLSSIETARGEHHSADLYIDCSGPHRSLLSDDARARWVPAPLARDYRMAIDHQHRSEAPRAYASLHAQPDGWRLSQPRGSEDITLELKTDAPEDWGLPFLAGHLEQPWEGNCLALGNAAACLLPTEPLQAKFLMASLERLVSLLPGRDCAPAETKEFNDLFGCDAQEAHALGTLFEAWRQFGDLSQSESEILAALPAELALRLRLFSRRGWISPRDSQLIPDSTWSSTFIALGVVPDTHDRLADRIPRDQVDQNLQALRARVKAVADTFPSYATYFDAVRKAATQSEGAR